MVQYIDASKLNQGIVGNPIENRMYIKYAADFTTDPLDFQFPQGAQTLNIFGVPRCMFIDNQANNYELNVSVGSTGQTFPVPASSAGFYYIDAVVGSNIVVTATGDPPAVVTFIFYNFDRAPVVWYKTSVTSSAVTIANGADVALGSLGDVAVTNPAASASTNALLKGILTGINAGTSGVGNIVRQPTAADLNATVVTSNGGNVALGATTDLAITNPATNGSLIAFIRGILTGINSAVTNLATLVTSAGAYTYRRISTATTTVVKNASGVVQGVTINTGVAGTATIYDNTAGSGTVIAVVDTTNRGFIEFGGSNGVTAATGITVVTSAAADITVSYR